MSNQHLPLIPPEATLIFVYHSESGLFHTAVGWVHKLMSPATYDCPLCAQITGPCGMLRAWRTYVEGLPLRVRYLYRDTLPTELPEVSNLKTPLVLLHIPEKPIAVVLGAEEIRRADCLSTLIACLDESLRYELKLRRVGAAYDGAV